MRNLHGKIHQLGICFIQRGEGLAIGRTLNRKGSALRLNMLPIDIMAYGQRDVIWVET